MVRIIPVLVLLFGCGGGGAKPATSPSTPAAKRLILLDADGVGLGGHDPVAYNIESAAVAGSSDHESKHEGAKYRFASEEHKKTFEAGAGSYVPNYGGYCAYAASQNRLSESDPTVFQIVDGQLLVFTNADYKERFNQDVKGNKAKADANWPGLVTQYGK